MYVNLMSDDKKVIRKIGGSGGTLELSVHSSSTSSTWKIIGQKLNTKCDMDKLFFILKKDGEEIHHLKDAI